MSNDNDSMYNPDYIRIIEKTLTHSLTDYTRIMALRVDLRFPVIDNHGDMPTCFINLDKVMSRFIDSLNAKLKHYQYSKRRKGQRTYLNRLRYVWVKEQSSSELPHYHCVLIFNKDAHYHLGDYNLDEPSLRTMITSAWYSALQLQLDPITNTGALVEYPIHGKYCLDQNSSSFEADYAVLMERLNYLAKDYSKHYSASSRSIGYSMK
ncbi:inovirus Gp2 family protein [Providencia sp. PROV254]|uniref:inovirus Gp2 family protein n=1 Tax=Providencia sp. PROV254 TaxID=2949942 RepID=UPI002349B2CB|nr:inovirus Gp2 family protein [Providencia sp. PROV254]